MAQTYFPNSELIEFVEAECGNSAHPEGTRYKVSIGNEVWGDGFRLVVKVQMQYEKTGLQGRRSPSYPLGTNDYDNVHKAIERLIKEAVL
ncbi:hypothetical protein [Psychrobacter frigidicola]|uniref:hypothetical protein n=1 Tax=Psychrobacter frigidicola TaxID=45611 RepID=UPI0019194136|nr:hypothetical protein [Psychrobacter frigidicola]